MATTSPAAGSRPPQVAGSDQLPDWAATRVGWPPKFGIVSVGVMIQSGVTTTPEVDVRSTTVTEVVAGAEVPPSLSRSELMAYPAAPPLTPETATAPAAPSATGPPFPKVAVGLAGAGATAMDLLAGADVPPSLSVARTETV